MHNASTNRTASLVAMLALLACSGCGPGMVEEKLIGEWVGEPDPTAGVVQRPVSSAGDFASDEVAEGEATRTDLEAFAFRITLQFQQRGAAAMWLNDNQQPINGSWQVLDALADRVQLELTDQPPSADADEQAPPARQRRFEVRFADDGQSFTLVEEGADKLFGRLLFRRSS